jgi:hypothetical protein
MYGASLSDPDKLFNDELAGNQRRANLFHEADGIAEDSLKTLIREAIGFKQARSRR